MKCVRGTQNEGGEELLWVLSRGRCSRRMTTKTDACEASAMHHRMDRRGLVSALSAFRTRHTEQALNEERSQTRSAAGSPPARRAQRRCRPAVSPGHPAPCDWAERVPAPPRAARLTQASSSMVSPVSVAGWLALGRGTKAVASRVTFFTPSAKEPSRHCRATSAL